MAGSIMRTEAKIRWIIDLVSAGIGEIEVGSFVSPRLVPQMADTGEIVAAARGLSGPRVSVLVPNLRSAQAAYEAGAQEIDIPVSVSEGHSRANVNKTPWEQVGEVRKIVEWSRAQTRPLHIRAGCATAFGCSIDGVIPAAQVLHVTTALLEAGVDDLVLADTVGYGHPALVTSLVRAVQNEAGPRLIGLHLHDTMGLGLANALAGLEQGIRCFDSALAGMGGCPFAPGASGNIVTEDLERFSLSPIQKRIPFCGEA
jgi:hydroxymethylglutaryl-CoA lyase